MTPSRKYSGIADYCRFHFGSLRWARKAGAESLARGVNDALDRQDSRNAHRLERLFLRKADGTQAPVARAIGVREVQAGQSSAAVPLLSFANQHNALQSAADFQCFGHALMRDGRLGDAVAVLRNGTGRFSDAALCGEAGNAALMAALSDPQNFERWRGDAVRLYAQALNLPRSSQTDTSKLQENGRVASALGRGVVYGVSTGLANFSRFEAGKPTRVKQAVLGAIRAGATYTTTTMYMLPTYINGTMTMTPQFTVHTHRRPRNDAAAAQISTL